MQFNEKNNPAYSANELSSQGVLCFYWKDMSDFQALISGKKNQMRAEEAQRNQVNGVFPFFSFFFLRINRLHQFLYSVVIRTDVLVYDGAAVAAAEIYILPA